MHFALVLAAVYPISYLATRFIEEPIKGFMRDYIDPRPVKKDVDAVTETGADAKNWIGEKGCCECLSKLSKRECFKFLNDVENIQ
jgi:hypothetical protein